ncbi:MAG: type II and III secretion system protein family protein, partial [Pseudomonadota bacterium]
MSHILSAAKGLVVVAAAVMTLIQPAAAQRGINQVKIDMGGESEYSKSIVLPLNKAAIVNLPSSAADVLVSQPSIVDAVVRSSRRVYLLGLSVGETNAFFFDNQGRQILNLEIRVERDMDAITDLLHRLMPDSRITLDAINDNVVIRGSVNNNSEAANAQSVVSRFVGNPDNVINMLSVRQRDQVMLRVRIVEMQHQLMKQLGVNTNGTVTLDDIQLGFAASNAVGATGGFSGSGGINGPIGDLTNLDVAFEALETTGLVKILAEPNLTAISGESANFLAGGEFPVPVGQRNGILSVEFREFGVGLGFTPVVLDKGRINLKVSTEVSDLTTDNSIIVPGATTVDADGQLIAGPSLQIPGLTVRRANTTVELASGGSLVMAGLLQEDLRSTMSGVPGLKDVAVLGQLFRSRDFENSQTELVIIVTPFIVKGTQLANLTDPTEGFVPTSDLQNILFGKVASTYGLGNTDARDKSLQGPLGFILD